jgi:hypothetical protein
MRYGHFGSLLGGALLFAAALAPAAAAAPSMQRGHGQGQGHGHDGGGGQNQGNWQNHGNWQNQGGGPWQRNVSPVVNAAPVVIPFAVPAPEVVPAPVPVPVPVPVPTLQAAVLPPLQQVFSPGPFQQTPLQVLPLQDNSFALIHPLLFCGMDVAGNCDAIAAQLAAITPGWGTAVLDGPDGYGVYVTYQPI